MKVELIDVLRWFEKGAVCVLPNDIYTSLVTEQKGFNAYGGVTTPAFNEILPVSTYFRNTELYSQYQWDFKQRVDKEVKRQLQAKGVEE